MGRPRRLGDEHHAAVVLGGELLEELRVGGDVVAGVLDHQLDLAAGDAPASLTWSKYACWATVMSAMVTENGPERSASSPTRIVSSVTP